MLSSNIADRFVAGVDRRDAHFVRFQSAQVGLVPEVVLQAATLALAALLGQWQRHLEPGARPQLHARQLGPNAVAEREG